MSTEPDVSAGFSPAPAAPAADACVMLVHGLYMNPLWMRPLARRLRAAGWRTADLDRKSVV